MLKSLATTRIVVRRSIEYIIIVVVKANYTLTSCTTVTLYTSYELVSIIEST